MISTDTVRQLRKKREWRELEAHILGAIAELDTVADIEGDDRAVAIEVAARKHAAKTLRDILDPFVMFQELEADGESIRAMEEDAGL